MPSYATLISQLRREFRDVPRTSQVAKTGDGSANLFAIGRYPIVEGSVSVYKGTSAQTSGTHYFLDMDNGEVSFVSAPTSAYVTKVNFKHAWFRDRDWVEAVNNGISWLNSRGFFRQIVRSPSLFHLSANVRVYNAPSACVDLYELLLHQNRTSSGAYIRTPGRWEYQNDQNKVTLEFLPSVLEPATISYLRAMQTYTATSATVDVKDEWLEAVKMKAGEYFHLAVASRLAREGNQSIEEGHFSFTNLRTMAETLGQRATELSVRLKPTRPAKNVKFAEL